MNFHISSNIEPADSTITRLVTIRPDGTCVESRSVILTMQCSMSGKLFPSDSQSCTATFQSSVYTMSEVQLIAGLTIGGLVMTKAGKVRFTLT
jgi:hypothetical protein